MKRFFPAVVLASALVFGSAGCTQQPTPQSTATYVPDDAAVLVDGFHWGGVPNSIADPLRCNGNLDRQPKDMTPCLKQVWTFTFTDGGPGATGMPDGYNAVYMNGSETLGITTGKDNLFLLIIKQGDTCKVVRDYTSDTDYKAKLVWESDSVATTFIVATWDPTDKHNQSVNRPGLSTPCAWSEVIPQVISVR